MSTYIGRVEVRRSEVLTMIGEEAKIEPQGTQEPFGKFARRINAAFADEDKATEVAEFCLAKWINRARTDVGPSRPAVRQSPNVEKVPMGQLPEESDPTFWTSAFEVWLEDQDDDKEVDIGFRLLERFKQETLHDPHSEEEDNVSEEEPLVEEPDDPTADENLPSESPFELGRAAGALALNNQQFTPNPFEVESLSAGEWQRGYDSVTSVE